MHPVTLWNDPAFVTLDPVAKAAYFCIAAKVASFGLGVLIVQTLPPLVNCTAEQLSAALEGLRRRGWIDYDDHGVFRVYSLLLSLEWGNGNHQKYFRSRMQEFPVESPVAQQFERDINELIRLKENAKLRTRGDASSPAPPFQLDQAPSDQLSRARMPSRSHREQEQEQVKVDKTLPSEREGLEHQQARAEKTKSTPRLPYGPNVGVDNRSTRQISGDAITLEDSAESANDASDAYNDWLNEAQPGKARFTVDELRVLRAHEERCGGQDAVLSGLGWLVRCDVERDRLVSESSARWVELALPENERAPY